MTSIDNYALPSLPSDQTVFKRFHSATITRVHDDLLCLAFNDAFSADRSRYSWNLSSRARPCLRERLRRRCPASTSSSRNSGHTPGFRQTSLTSTLSFALFTGRTNGCLENNKMRRAAPGPTTGSSSRWRGFGDHPSKTPKRIPKLRESSLGLPYVFEFERSLLLISPAAVASFTLMLPPPSLLPSRSLK